MKRAIITDFTREIKKNRNQFLSIFFIVTLGVAFLSGVRSTQPDMKFTADTYYDSLKMMDLRILSPTGLTKEDLSRIEKIQGVEKAVAYQTGEAMCYKEEQENAVKVLSLVDDMDEYQVVDGRLPESQNECFIDDTFLKNTGLNIGDKIILDMKNPVQYASLENQMEVLKEDEVTIVGAGKSSWYLNYDRGTGTIGNGKMNGFVVVPIENFNSSIYTEIHIRVANASEKIAYTKDYEDLINQVKERIEEQEPSWYVFDRTSIQNYVEYSLDSDRIGAIGKVFPLIFFLVAALVSLTTMTRMVEEQRMQIGTLKALGYSNITITLKFILYAFLASLGGSIVGTLIGEQLFPMIIMKAYGTLYIGITKYYAPWQLEYGIGATLAAVICTTLATLAACYKELLAKPAVLMRPVSPKNGKKIILERIPFIWKLFSFTQKATARNLFRYKKRFFMTVFGIGGCMALLIVGFGLRDSIFDILRYQYKEIFTYNVEITLNPYATLEENEKLVRFIEQESNIKSSLPIYKMNMKADAKEGEEEKAVILIVADDTKENTNEFISLRNRKTKEQYDYPTSGVAITEKMAKNLDLEMGDKIRIKSSETEFIEEEITQITENYLYHYIFMSKEEYEKIYGVTFQPNEILMTTNEQSDIKEKELGEQLINQSACTGISFTTTIYDMLDQMLGRFNIVIWVLIISAGLLAFVVLFNLNNINITERRRELASIKVLGFYDGEVAAYVYRENVFLTLFGIAAGCVIGVWLHRYVIGTVEIEMMMFGRTIKGLSFLYGSLITLLFSAVVNFIMYFYLKKIDMVESLKSVE